MKGNEFFQNNQTDFSRVGSSQGVYPIGSEAFLTQFTGASAGYSLRKLSTPATDVVRVRRSSDDTEQDFNANEVKGAGLLDFVVPTDVQALYSNAMYFDGVDDYVSLGTGDAFSLNGSSKIEFRGWVVVENSSSGAIFLQNITSTNAGFALSISSGSLGVFARSQSADSVQTHTQSISNGLHYVKGYADFANDEIGISIDNSPYSTNAVTFGSDTYVNGSPTGDVRIGASVVAFYTGVLYDVEFYKDDVLSNSYLGNNNTNAGWTDQTGSVDGTVNGSPALFTGQGFNGFVSTWYDQNVPTSKDVMNFDGVDDYVNTGSSFQTTMRDSFSVVADIKGFTALPTGVTDTIFGTEVSNGNYLSIDFRTDGKVDFVYSSNSNIARATTSTDVLTALIGTDFTIEYITDDTARQLSIKINGVTQTLDVTNNGDMDTNSVVMSAYTQTSSFLIGGRLSSATPQFFFKGIIDSLKVYEDASQTTLVSSYINTGNTNADWTDQVGSNDGTVAGSPARLSTVDYTTISKDLVQTTTSLQPSIVENGAVNLENGKPTLKNDGTKWMEVPDSIGDFNFLHNGTKSGVFTVARVADSSNPDASYCLYSTFTGATAAIGTLLTLDDRSSLSRNDAYRMVVGRAVNGQYAVNNLKNDVLSFNVQHLISTLFDANSVTAANRDIGRVDGGTNIQENIETGAPSAGNSEDNFKIMTTGDNSLIMVGSMQEFILFSSDQSANRTAIETNINNHYSIY